MNGTTSKPTSTDLIPAEQIPVEQIPMEQLLDIYKKIIHELIATFELDEETTDLEPLPAPVG